MRYWSNLFTYDTWMRRHPRQASWAANRHKTAAELGPGDTVIAYVAKIGWTGAYRTSSSAELDASGSFGDEYPLLADIEPIVELEPEDALTIADLPGDAPLRRRPGADLPQPGTEQRQRAVRRTRRLPGQHPHQLGAGALQPSLDAQANRACTPSAQAGQFAGTCQQPRRRHG